MKVFESGELDAIADRATSSLLRAHELVEADMAVMPDRYALVAIADQLALANALKIVELARAGGEFTAIP